MGYIKVFLVAMVIATLFLQSEAWRRRRRRRSCRPVHCAVSGWSPPNFSACSSPCGSTGTQFRKRTITRHPSCGGNGCPVLHETRACNRFCHNGGSPIPGRCHCRQNNRGRCCEIVDGGWSSWSSWGRCARTCGTALHARTRSCSHPKPGRGGKPCRGAHRETKICSIKPCPVHGGWSLWGSWSTCSKSCGTGTQLRHRTCTNPRPAFGGRTCQSQGTEKQACNGTETCLFIKGLGCYKSKWTKLLKDFRQEMDWSDRSKLVTKCAALAKQNKIPFFGISYFTRCVTDYSKTYDYIRIQPAVCFDKVGMHGSMYVYIVQ